MQRTGRVLNHSLEIPTRGLLDEFTEGFSDCSEDAKNLGIKLETSGKGY